MAAMTVATFVMYEQTGGLLFARLASLLLGITTVLITGLLIRTAIAVSRREICQED
jgi:tellurite resistance protein